MIDIGGKMKYLYIINCSGNNKQYVGKTVNIERRLSDHKWKLANNKHKNPSLQSAYNKYGKDSFSYKIIELEGISDEELNEKERELIAELDTFHNGFNLTLGGDGGNTRGNLSYEDYATIYLGAKAHNGLGGYRIAKALKVDSSTVSHLINEESYLFYLKKVQEEEPDSVQAYIKRFEELIDLKNNPLVAQQKRLDEELVLDIMCAVTLYGKRGTEAKLLRHFGIATGLMHRTFKGPNFQGVVSKYASMTPENVTKRAEEFVDKHNLDLGVKHYKDRFEHYKIERPS